ncbi:MAG TPA: DNA gyrase inhibitor YacG [Polyangia bacterium]|nr:DNA gyrase inhibitor YacG [Polyangia bacterium]
MKRKCPTCGRSFEQSEETLPFRPFCSARCRAADLGKWLDGGYRIATPITDDAELDDGGGGDGESGGSKLPQ